MKSQINHIKLHLKPNDSVHLHYNSVCCVTGFDHILFSKYAFRLSTFPSNFFKQQSVFRENYLQNSFLSKVTVGQNGIENHGVH